jgi:hypothetical protein
MEDAMKLILSMLALTFATSMVAKETYAPLPEKLMQAKTVYIENKTGDARVADTIYRELPKWKKYVLVNERSKSALVFVLTMATHEAIYTNGTRVTNQIGPTTRITTGGKSTATPLGA